MSGKTEIPCPYCGLLVLARNFDQHKGGRLCLREQQRVTISREDAPGRAAGGVGDEFAVEGGEKGRNGR